MCDAWLLRPRHGPDGARAHTGYAYGHSAGAELRPKPRCTPQLGLALRPPSQGAITRGLRRLRCSQPYAQCRGRLQGDAAKGCRRGEKRRSVRLQRRSRQLSVIIARSSRTRASRCGPPARKNQGSDLATHQGGLQHKGSPRPRLISLPPHTHSLARSHSLRALAGGGEANVRLGRQCIFS